MPYLKIETNQNLEKQNEDSLTQKLSSHLADLLSKPEQYIMISCQTGLNMRFATTTEPLAYLELKSLGLQESSTEEFSNSLCTLVAELLSIPPDRIYIEFSSPERHLWGWNNRTFA